MIEDKVRKYINLQDIISSSQESENNRSKWRYVLSSFHLHLTLLFPFQPFSHTNHAYSAALPLVASKSPFIAHLMRLVNTNTVCGGCSSKNLRRALPSRLLHNYLRWTIVWKKWRTEGIMKQHPLPHHHLQPLLESLNRIVCLAYLANPLGNHCCMFDVSHGKA